MKYQPQHDLIDPEVAPAPVGFQYHVDVDDAPDAPNDAYVIGEDGVVVQAPDAQAPTDSHNGPKPWAKPAAFVLVALFVAMTAWNLTHLIKGPPPRPNPTPFQVKQALYLGVMKIDTFRREHGVTPDSLTEAGLPEPGPYGYRRIDSTHYVISFDGNGAKLEYNSDDSKESFFGSPKELLTMGETQ
jgi:hypothetical protein